MTCVHADVTLERDHKGASTAGHPVSPVSRGFSRFASAVAHASGKPVTFALAALTVVAWALTGPLFGFSDTWQLVINTGTTIVTFLMVFLIQSTQNRDGAAIQAKLDELIRASAAQNRYIGIEALSEDELRELKERCARRASESRPELEAAADEAQQAANVAADRAKARVA